MPVDMVEIDLKQMWSTLGEIIGETYTDELIDQIMEEFLLGWPNCFWEKIKEIEEYTLFRQELLKYKQIGLIYEQGDFTPNNVLELDNGDICLLDFEFTKRLQPIGFDLFDWHYSTDKM